jgi:hypothetical protein
VKKSLTLLLASLATAGCEKRGATVITLGVNLDRTGSIATKSWSDSVDLAVADANRGLQTAGHPEFQFAVAAANSHNAPDSAVTNAIDLVKNRSAKAIITDSSGDQIAQGMLAYDGDPAHDLRVPLVCMACTSSDLGDPNAVNANPVRQAALRNDKGWLFRTTVADSYQSRVVIRLLAEATDRAGGPRAGALHLAIWASDDPYGHSFAEALKREAAAQRPGAVVEAVFHPMNVDVVQYDWAGEVTKALGARPADLDAVIEVSFPKFAAAFSRAFAANGAKTRFLHTHNFRSLRVLEPLGNIAERQEGTSQVNLGTGPSADTFAQELKSVTGFTPSFRDAPAYDAAMSVMLAAVVASHGATADPSKVTGDAIRVAMHQISNKAGEKVFAGPTEFARAVHLAAAGKPFDYEGASGPCDFDAHGNIVAQLARFSVVKGDFADVDRFDCVSSPDCPQIALHGAR